MKHRLILILIAAAVTPFVVFAHGGDRLMGTVKAIDGDTLLVTSTDGHEVSVRITAETKISKGKEPGTLADIEVGGRLVVQLAKDGSAAEIRLPAEE